MTDHITLKPYTPLYQLFYLYTIELIFVYKATYLINQYTIDYLICKGKKSNKLSTIYVHYMYMATCTNCSYCHRMECEHHEEKNNHIRHSKRQHFLYIYFH